MSKLQELKTRDINQQKVGDWLDFIGEHDEQCRAEVFAHCKADTDAMAYYVGRYDTRSGLDKCPKPLTAPVHERILDRKSMAAGEVA